MDIAMVGLGRMGMNMARRLMQGNHRVVAYNKTHDKTEELEKEGAVAASSLSEAVGKLISPRVVWLMIPAGKPVHDTVAELSGLLSEGDIVVDGGNSPYSDDPGHFESLKEKGIHFLDVGVSGGIWGLEEGYCLMAGGERSVYEYIEPVLKTLATGGGYLYCGPSGAGHFVKMVHNGIEYGMMQAYGEGFEILEKSPYGGSLHFGDVARLWNHGSVIRSWLLELLEGAFDEDPHLSAVRGYVEDTGEGRWTVQQAIDSGVPAPVMALSLFQRFRSRMDETFSDKVLAALRGKFGGHRIVSKADVKE